MKSTLNRLEWWFRQKCCENFLLSGSLFDRLVWQTRKNQSGRVHLNLFFVWNYRVIHRYASTPQNTDTVFGCRRAPFATLPWRYIALLNEALSNPIRIHCSQWWIWNRWKTALCTQSWTEKQQCYKYLFTRTNLSPMMQNLVQVAQKLRTHPDFRPPGHFPACLVRLAPPCRDKSLKPIKG